MAMGITPINRIMGPQKRRWKIERLARKRIRRCWVAMSKTASAQETWLQTSSALPSSGTFSEPIMRRR